MLYLFWLEMIPAKNTDKLPVDLKSSTKTLAHDNKVKYTDCSIAV